MPWLPCRPLLCPDFTCQLGVLPMVNLVYSFAAGKNSGSSTCPLPSPLAHEVCPEVLSPRQVNYVSTQLLCMEWESLKSVRLDLCSVWPHCSALLIRLSAGQSPPRIPQGEVETEHNPPTVSWHLVNQCPTPHTIQPLLLPQMTLKKEKQDDISILTLLSPPSHNLLRPKKRLFPLLPFPVLTSFTWNCDQTCKIHLIAH